MFFYMSKGDGFGSQSLTSVGIVEGVRLSDELSDVIRLTAKRSVYSAEELSQMVDERNTPLKIIDFLLVGHLEPTIPLDQLVYEGVLRAAPQSISHMPEPRYSKLKPLLKLGFSF